LILGNWALTLLDKPMPENATYANLQKGTIINVGALNVFQPIALKLKHFSDADYHSINTNPDEISDLFIVFYYALGN
jgi:hypothetical protein